MLSVCLVVAATTALERTPAPKDPPFALLTPAATVEKLGAQLHQVGAKLAQAADVPQQKPGVPPTTNYLQALMQPTLTPLLAGARNPLANPYASPLMRIAAPIVADPYNPARLLSPGLLGLRSPRISQYGQVVPPLPYPFALEP